MTWLLAVHGEAVESPGYRPRAVQLELVPAPGAGVVVDLRAVTFVDW